MIVALLEAFTTPSPHTLPVLERRAEHTELHGAQVAWPYGQFASLMVLPSSSRHNAMATRNLRLTVIRTFFRHLVRQDPSRGAQYQRVLSLPYKRAPTKVIAYLEPEEVACLRNRTSAHSGPSLRGAHSSQPARPCGVGLRLL